MNDSLLPTTIEKYSELIENLASNNESMPYFNSGPEHATIVFSKIFKYSKSEVDILAGNMAGGISSKEIYLKELEKFLKRKGKLKILLEEYNYDNNPQLFSLLAQYQFFDSNQVQIKRMNGQTVINTETNRKIHFCVSDKKIYRVEDDVEKKNAKGSFNDSVTAIKLKRIFDELSVLAVPVSL